MQVGSGSEGVNGGGVGYGRYADYSHNYTSRQQQQQPQYSSSPMTTEVYAGGLDNGQYASSHGHHYADSNYQQHQPQQQQYQQHQQQQQQYQQHQPQPYPQLASHSYPTQAQLHPKTDYSDQPDPTLAALRQTDANGLRWTWTTYPTTERVKDQERRSVASIPLPPLVVPLACMYTPLHPLPAAAIVHGDPVQQGQQCSNCGAFCCMYSRIDVAGHYWGCISCLRRNSLSPHFALNHPALRHGTVEYVMQPPALAAASVAPAANQLPPPPPITAPVFIYVIDTCLSFEDLRAVKTSVLDSLKWLPPDAHVGMVSFGRGVVVWEPGCRQFDKGYALRGERSYKAEEFATMLQLSDETRVLDRFFVPASSATCSLASIIEDLRVNPFLVPSKERPLRATGTAVESAVRLLEALHTTKVRRGATPPTAIKAGSIMLLTGGPCTRGPGTVVGVQKEEMMRFHRDIVEGETPHYEAAFKFYNDLERRMSELNTCLNVYAMSYDQIGIMEMREAVNNTGGIFVCGDQFDHPMFKNSFEQSFERSGFTGSAGDNSAALATSMQPAAASPAEPARAGFGVTLEVFTSEDTLICGALGPCNVDTKSNKQKPTRAASPQHIGVGGTTRWCVSFVDQSTTLSFIFDTATLESTGGGSGGMASLFSRSTPSSSASPAASGGASSSNSGGISALAPMGSQPNAAAAAGGRSQQRQRFFQFVTRYQTVNGQIRVRVTSVTQPVAPVSSAAYLLLNMAFDQACAATVLARMCVSILERFPNKWEETKRWLDTMLVRFVRYFSSFRPGEPDSVRLASSVSFFPSFMYNLRRSEYFMILNISPDETTFKRHWLMREGCDACVLMIQPTLDTYTINEPFATPVPLDSASLKQDNILLMDAFFNVHIMWGTTIYEWMEQKFQENPDYAYFAELLQAVENDAQAVLSTRFPYPRFSRTDADGSEARHIKTRMNPTTTHHQQQDQQQHGYGVRGQAGANDGTNIIYTDDASISTFMVSLKQAVTAAEGK